MHARRRKLRRPITWSLSVHVKPIEGRIGSLTHMGAGTGEAGWASAHPEKNQGGAWPTLEILAVV